MFFLINRISAMKLIILLSTGLFFISPSYGQGNQLRLTPSKCVALKKGQVCYQSIRIRYESLDTQNYCLTVSNQDGPLQCWSSVDLIDYRYRFASKNDLEFKIIDLNEKILATANFNIAWVYKQSRKRNRWRLF